MAERFPRLTLSAVLNTEKQFAEADGNNDGVRVRRYQYDWSIYIAHTQTIDLDELEQVLDKCGLLFTKKQVQEILHTIDTDDSGTLDVMECLEVPDLYKTPTKFGNALHNKHTKVYKLSPSQLHWLHAFLNSTS